MKLVYWFILLGFMIAFVTPPSMAANAEKPPVIGISGSAGDSKSVAAMMSMVRSLGAEPLLLANHSQRISIAGGLDAAIKDDLSMVDAVIVMGNNGDIDPASYGAAKSAHTNIETDTARRDYENALIQEVTKRKMPLLGICGGHQRINVLAGGTLHQHVPDLVGDNHHMQGDIPGFIPVQYVGIAQDTMLGKMAGDIKGVYTPTHQPLPANVVMENSFHHQAIDKVASGFRVSAASSDGIIEGIEADPLGKFRDQFIMGVQWHPEFGASALGPKIVERVINEGKEYAKTHPKAEAIQTKTSFTENLLSSLNVIKNPDIKGASTGLTQDRGTMLDYVMNRREKGNQKAGIN
jgi:putative glutamine amidotransferase